MISIGDYVFPQAVTIGTISAKKTQEVNTPYLKADKPIYLFTLINVPSYTQINSNEHVFIFAILW